MIEHARWTLGKSLKDFRIGIADETEVLSAIEALIEAKKHPPQRTWQGLTDEEMDTEADKKEQGYGFIQGALWAEDKLKEKNT